MSKRQQTPQVDGRGDREEQPPVDEPVRCPGCETTRQWASFDTPPEDVDATGTCPACGTHILGFDTITEDDREEWRGFLRSVADRFESKNTAAENGKSTS
jgi:hypothetical protein